MSYSFKLFLFAALFAALCIKAVDLCSAGTPLTGLGKPEVEANSVVDPAPLKSHQREFRGLSPWPDMSERLPLPKRGGKD